MASAKVIYTYKRKRLSSHSGDGHVAVCPDYTSNFEYDKCRSAIEGRSENLEKDLKRTCHVEKLLHTCSSPRVHKLSICHENDSAQDSDATHKRETTLNSYDLSGGKIVKSSSENILTEVGNIRNSMTKDVNSFLPHVDNNQIMGTSVTYSEQKGSDSLCKRNNLCDSEHVQAIMNAPLLTFSRRLKRKVNQKIFSELTFGEGSATIKESKLKATYTNTCEVTSSKGKYVKVSLDLNLEVKNLLCASKDEMDNRENPCSGSCLETLKDLNVDMSSVTAPTVTTTLGSNSALSSNMDDVWNNLKGNVRCSSNDGTVLFCDDTVKSNDHRVSHQLQGSDGKSQLTSNILERKVSSGGFVIDCNTIPGSDLQDQESDTVFHSSLMVKSHGDGMKNGHTKTQGLEFFGPLAVQSNNSLLQDVSASVEGGTQPEIKCLESHGAIRSKVTKNWSKITEKQAKLFSEDVKKDTEKVVCSKAKQNVTYAHGSEKDWLERSSNGFLGLSRSTEPSLGQSSKHGFIPPISDQFIQCPPVHPSFLDHATSSAFRRRTLLESINTETTALTGNETVSSVNFDPGSAMWTEEELDSLWIGIRRHGRGNWRAMLLDPRLHFVPWRSPRDLALQWEQEQVKLLNGQYMIQDTYVSPPGPYNLGCDVGFLCSTSGCLSEKLSADTRLSLGDVYFGSGIINSRKGESHSYGLFNDVRVGDHLEMGFVTNDDVPHWLRGILVAPSRQADPTVPQIRAHRFVHPYPQRSGSVYQSRNLINNDMHSRPIFLNAGPSTINQGMTDNPIVINSDDSSEGTISDDHNIQS